ncbi:MAG: hypothetical protein NTU94_01950 [Planctomycetota bacterium]|nr:hypothetical protein [Planctomycetota bacterium]
MSAPSPVYGFGMRSSFLKAGLVSKKVMVFSSPVTAVRFSQAVDAGTRTESTAARRNRRLQADGFVRMTASFISPL